MKIVMLGFSGAGKTTYMASLYSILQREVEGFSLKAANSDAHKTLLELADNIFLGKYPQLTDQRSEYEFQLRYQGKDVFPFTWADYRGGAIRETQDSPQAKLLLQDLRQADGIMMFCDCDTLANGNSRSNQLGRMVSLVTHALQGLEHPISLAIMLTKSDLINNFREDMLLPFQGIISAIEVSDFVSSAFIPIACSRKLINVPIPLLFALHTGAINQAFYKSYLGLHHLSNSLDWIKKSQGFFSGLRWMVDKFVGNPTDEELAFSELTKAMEQFNAFEAIQEPAEALGKCVEKLPVIKKGISLKDYEQKINQMKSGDRSLLQRILGINAILTLDPFNAFK